MVTQTGSHRGSLRGGSLAVTARWSISPPDISVSRHHNRSIIGRDGLTKAGSSNWLRLVTGSRTIELKNCCGSWHLRGVCAVGGAAAKTTRGQHVCDKHKQLIFERIVLSFARPSCSFEVRLYAA